jgi:hypothetical protein
MECDKPDDALRNILAQNFQPTCSENKESGVVGFVSRCAALAERRAGCLRDLGHKRLRNMIHAYVKMKIEITKAT